MGVQSDDKKLWICVSAGKCKSYESLNCSHNKPHKHIRSCSSVCAAEVDGHICNTCVVIDDIIDVDELFEEIDDTI